MYFKRKISYFPQNLEKSKTNNRKIGAASAPAFKYIGEILLGIDIEGTHFFLQFLFTL